jgi:hypothetical protein
MVMRKRPPDLEDPSQDTSTTPGGARPRHPEHFGSPQHDESSGPAPKPPVGHATGTGKATTGSWGPPSESEYEKLANAQADQYLSMVGALDPLTSGAALPAIDQNIAQGADKMLGVSGNSGIAGWLDQQTAAAQQQGAGVTAAGAALGQAEDANAQGIAGGLQQMGVAETNLMKEAPYQQLLSSLAAEVPYHLASGYSIPGMTKANTPGWLQQAETNVGVTPTAASSGSNPQAKGLLPPPTTTAAPPTYTPPAPGQPSNPGG